MRHRTPPRINPDGLADGAGHPAASKPAAVLRGGLQDAEPALA